MNEKKKSSQKIFFVSFKITKISDLFLWLVFGSKAESVTIYNFHSPQISWETERFLWIAWSKTCELERGNCSIVDLPKIVIKIIARFL